MAYTTIKKPSDYFNTKLYTGTGSSNSVTGVGFQPDMTWFKHRSGTSEHNIYDAVRGATKRIIPNDTSAEGTQSNGLSAFGSDGFTVVNSNATNLNNQTYASWNWKANGAGSANTDGSINSTVSVNTTSGFSIVSYTGNGTGNSTIGHGLGATPKFIIVKNLTTAQDWGTYSPSFVSASDPNVVYLSKSAAQADDTNVWGTSATFNNNTFTVGDWTGSNQSGSSFIAYCFADVQGFSKFGSYTGNGNNDGTFVYTGFKPAFVMVKNTSIVEQWSMHDNKRNDNVIPNYARLVADDNQAEIVNTLWSKVELFSNGFKLGNSADVINASGGSFIYMAFAEEPLVGDNPATAR